MTPANQQPADPEGSGLTTAHISIPAAELAAIDAAAKAAHVSRSFALREGARLWLKSGRGKAGAA
jgi:hypothetical protein